MTVACGIFTIVVVVMPYSLDYFCVGCFKDNLASNGTAKQNQPKPSHPARLAIDGNRTNGQCSMTTGPGSYLQIDTRYLSVVTTVYIIFGEFRKNSIARQIYLYMPRCANCNVTVTTGEHIVYCSNTSDSWVNGILLYKGERPTKDINVFAVCRYVIYLPPADSGVDVCEIEIGVNYLGQTQIY
ncbi:hypothetical protein AM593_00931, partial [Mytilus galloprovincialis]